MSHITHKQRTTNLAHQQLRRQRRRQKHLMSQQRHTERSARSDKMIVTMLRQSLPSPEQTVEAKGRVRARLEEAVLATSSNGDILSNDISETPLT